MAERSPHEQMTTLMSGYWHTQAIYVATKLGVADLLREGPRTAGELVAATGTNPRVLNRLLRALTSLGIFADVAGHRFTLTLMAGVRRRDGLAGRASVMRLP